MPTAFEGVVFIIISGLKSGVTKSIMPMALEANGYIIIAISACTISASAIGTADFVTWEFIPVLLTRIKKAEKRIQPHLLQDSISISNYFEVTIIQTLDKERTKK